MMKKVKCWRWDTHKLWQHETFSELYTSAFRKVGKTVQVPQDFFCEKLKIDIDKHN